MSTYDIARANAYFQDRVAFTTGVHEVEVMINSRIDKTGYQIVDVRYPADFAADRIPGAINLPKNQWKNPQGLDKDATLYLYCYTPTCHLAAEAAAQMTAQGYRVIEIEGGWSTWVANGYATQVAA